MLNNIINRFRLRQSSLLFFSTVLSLLISAQDSSYKRPAVTDKWDVYKQQVKANPDKRMVELKTLIPSIVYDLRYATVNNFMKRLMYPAGTKHTYMRSPAAKALKQVQAELAARGLGLKIYDAYRPYAVTVKFWELVHDERYVANPANGSGHNRGTSVDLTLISLSTGRELKMGTGFDNFTDTAHHSFTRLPEDVLENRKLLRSVMEKAGFKALETEWWHYSWPGSSQFEILDIDFKKLKKDL